MTLYSVLAAKCYWHFSVNKFKTLDKRNKINIILCRLLFVSLSFIRNANKLWIYHGSGWVQNKTSNSPAYITDQISFITWREMTDKKSEVTQTRRVRWHRQEEWGDTDKKSEVTQTRRVRWHRQEEWGDRREEWGDTDKKSEVTQTRRVRWHRQEEWGDTDKTMWKSFKTKCKSARFNVDMSLTYILNKINN